MSPSPKPQASSLKPYLILLRPANVVTALADVVAGFAVAGPTASLSALPWLLVSTAGLYGGGVVNHATKSGEFPSESFDQFCRCGAWLRFRRPNRLGTGDRCTGQSCLGDSLTQRRAHRGACFRRHDVPPRRFSHCSWNDSVGIAGKSRDCVHPDMWNGSF